MRKNIFKILLIIILIFVFSDLIYAQICGDTRYNVDTSSTDARSSVTTQLGSEQLLIHYYDYANDNYHTKIMETDGSVTTVNYSVSPLADSNTAIIAEGLSNGNIVVYWYSSSSSNGITDTYFKIIDQNGNDVKSTTKINTLAGSLNRFTMMAELSNGNILFTYATDGSNYSMRRFNSAGNAVDVNQLSLTSIAGLSSSQYKYAPAANSNGRFMIFISSYVKDYYAMIFDNDSDTPLQVGGNNSFVAASVNPNSYKDQTALIEALPNDKFLLVYRIQPTGDTADRAIAYKIYNDDGTVSMNEVVRRTIYSWGYIDDPIVTTNGFFLDYSYDDLGNGPNLGYRPYLEYFNIDGSFNTDKTASLPTLNAEWAERSSFSDIDGNLSFSVSDIDGGANYDLWLLRVSDETLPVVTTGAVSSITGNSAVLGGNITNDGGASVTERGIVYSSSDTTPTIGEGSVIKDTNGSGTGSFSETISGLTSATTYYFRAYAINSEGTSYGSIDNFTTKTPGLWVGGISSDWNNASNWDDSNVPTSTVNVTIPSGCSNYPTIDETAICQDITIENGGDISISSSFSLNVNGDFTLNDGGSFSNDGTLKFSGTSNLTDNRTTKSDIGDINVSE